MSAQAPEVTPIAQGAGVVVLDDTIPAVIPEAPAVVPEKFKNPDGSLNQAALLKSYTELEKMRGTEAPVTPASPSGEELKDGDLAVPNKEELKKAVGDALFKEVVDHYKSNGEVSEELYGKLNDQGFSKEFTGFVIDGLEREASDRRTSITNEVGGNEAYKEMQTWAVENLSDADKAAINAAVNGDDITTARMGAKHLRDLYRAAEGTNPNLVSGGAPNATEGFQSAEEFAQAINDPRWEVDAVFTRTVKDKLSKSTY